MTPSFDILYRDDELIAIDKPSGISVHRNEFEREAPACLQILRDQIGQHVHPVHRLDHGTSGVLLFALNKEMLARAMAMFAEGGFQKTYIAIVRGWMPSQTCTHALVKEDKIQEAETDFLRVMQTERPWPNERYPTSRYSLVEARPKTGRFHQIRRHAAHLGYPIVGDTAHGDGTHNQLWREHCGVHRLLLHAKSLTFTNPTTNVQTTIESPVPDALSLRVD